MIRPVILIGGGEHARVVAEAVRSRPDLYELRGFVDPAPCDETTSRLGVPRLGDESALVSHRDAFGVIALASLESVALRETIAQRCAIVLRGFAVIVHASAWVSPTAQLAEGVVVMAHAVVQTGASVGAHGLVNSGAVVEHDVQLGPFANVAPGAAIGGGARVGHGAFVGLGARVRDHVAIGERAIVAMGAVVVRQVPSGTTVKGNPAR